MICARSSRQLGKPTKRYLEGPIQRVNTAISCHRFRHMCFWTSDGRFCSAVHKPCMNPKFNTFA